MRLDVFLRRYYSTILTAVFQIQHLAEIIFLTLEFGTFMDALLEQSSRILKIVPYLNRIFTGCSQHRIALKVMQCKSKGTQSPVRMCHEPREIS
jgi:hypothetical protein